MSRWAIVLLLLGHLAWAADGAAAFNATAEQALEVMCATATSLKVDGAAAVAWIPAPGKPGQAIASWTSRMRVAGAFVGKNTNVLGVVYTKMAEMADTLQDSGSKVRPPLRGEYGYQGGLIAPMNGGYLLAAFSGGWDLRVAKAGLDVLVQAQAPKP